MSTMNGKVGVSELPTSVLSDKIWHGW